ncbi:ABC transporter substrate-binding protein [Caenimonas sedimenti]|nr:ABC transporter substrate-binding protein [Caenimonas sedimenti]
MTHSITRRAFVATASFVTLPSLAQTARVSRAAFLAQIARPEPMEPHIFGTLAKSLRQLGHVEGRNMAIEWRFANGDVDSLPRLASDIVARTPDIVIAAGTLSAVAMRKATTTIPVIFGNVSDPVGFGLVQSFHRSGTNMTGVTSQLTVLMPKLVEVMLEAMPKASRLALLMNPQQVSHAGFVASLSPMAERRQVRLMPYKAANPQEIEQAFSAMAKDSVDAAVVPRDGLFIQQSRQIGELAMRHRLAVGGFDEELARNGALLTFGSDQHIMFRKVAEYADRVLRGAKPQDLPVEQASDYVLVVNRSVESVLRVQLPQSLLVRADKLI